MTTRERPTADRFVLIAATLIVFVTVGWWAAALWPLPAGTPEWVLRARAACFGSTDTGLPNSGGWILLVGTPLTMFAALLLVAPSETRRTLRALRASRKGRWLLRTVPGILMALLLLAAGRVLQANGHTLARAAAAPVDFIAEPRPMSRAAPPLELIDQRGDLVSTAAFRGRPVIVTFAYGGCETVCPVIVRNVLTAREQLTDLRPAVVIVTLDPWRDTPARLPHIAAAWGLPDDVHLLGGSVPDVEAMLDSWEVGRARDPRTGEIAHASVAFVVDGEGVIRFATSGLPGQLTDAVRRVAAGDAS